MKTLKELTNEKFKEIYTNEKFRNEVAYAHGCYTSEGSFKYKKTCSYPDEYLVTDEQIEKATQLIKKRKQEVIKENKGNIVFVGMGMTYETDEEIGNHRIRAEFTNKQGRRFFIEFAKGCNGCSTRIDHSIDRTLEDQLNGSHNRQGEFYNCKGLESSARASHTPYKHKNLLELINREFDCNFKDLVVDNYNLTTDDINSVSPK